MAKRQVSLVDGVREGDGTEPWFAKNPKVSWTRIGTLAWEP